LRLSLQALSKHVLEPSAQPGFQLGTVTSLCV
jgi:hypothetical protein